MKGYLPIAVVILIVACIAACKRGKEPATASGPRCIACYNTVIGYERDSAGVYFFLPTAFTPNGDGKNDLLRLVYANLDTDSSGITIWDKTGKQLFSGNAAQHWDGRDAGGIAYPAGKYSAQVKIKTSTGKIYDICGCITILQYTGSCINVSGTDYFFEDQVNPDSAFLYTTGESICP